MNKIDIANLPQLKTPIGIYGSVKQTEVGAAPCLAAILLVAIA